MRSTSQRALAALLVPVIYLLLQVAGGTPPTPWTDTVRYARAAEQHAGVERADAQAAAVRYFCANTGRADGRAAELRQLPPDVAAVAAASEAACLRQYGHRPDVTTDDARYQSIFTTRWAYPWTLVPFVTTLGITDGLRLHALLTTLGCAVLAYGLLRSAGLSRQAAMAGQVALLASPLGWWSLQPLTEGLSLACTLAALWGALGLLSSKRRRLPYAALLSGSLLACFLLRYSTSLLLSGALAAAGAAIAGAVHMRRPTHAARSGALWVTTVSGSALCAGAGAVVLLGLPTSEVTLQDTFTAHFRLPLVADPWSRLWDLNAAYWPQWWSAQVTHPYLPALAAIACWALWHRARALCVLCAVTALVGVAQVAAHPLQSEAERLGVLMWLPIALGLPFMPSAWARRGNATPASPLPPARAALPDRAEKLPASG
ncbi:hypothetical protein G3I40_05250 [Streptomyces sp. SID14478]|uniref:hypothetical protein n=1 Tax=Streptomyces sp. SID14478 TaxID=2706073 RepID=UPI0013DC4A26|nr:hypothetical protein [Streptomyces sp. SID14478]NEB74640.1 hypothetical protein [Streptomyces sp. SID14478]